MQIPFCHFKLFLLSLLIGLFLANCGPPPTGEKLTLSPKAQLIGEEMDGEESMSCLTQIDSPDKETRQKRKPDQKQIVKVPVVKDFGEVGPKTIFPPENEISESEVQPHLPQARRWHFGAYRIFLWKSENLDELGGGVALYHYDTLAYARKGRFYLTNPEAKEDDDDWDHMTVKGPVPGADIDGDGIPDFILYEHTGGAHCCYIVQHVECGKKPLLRCEIHTKDSHPFFHDLNGDGQTEVRFEDAAYAYWNECFGDSPFPAIVLRIRNGHYEMAGDIMRTQGPSTVELSKKTKELRDLTIHYNKIVERLKRGGKPPKNDKIWDDRPQMWRNGHVSIPSTVWGVMLDLIYSGRCQEALNFVDEVWPVGKPGKQDFIRDVTNKVLESWFGIRLPWIGDLEKVVYGVTANQ